MRVVKKVSPRNRKEMKTSDTFLADKTCLFCEERKCKYAITQSEADLLTPLTSVHGIDKVFRLLYPVARNCTECAALGFFGYAIWERGYLKIFLKFWVF
ncbi:hypothetical protein CDAR_42601 [Caerostris darwini]|uniref:Uncharacterized protein n=1 Tax=Caerostris darwini TaxID=1538125 RepID=A0AAV4RKW1_9ARAC|nr:hypothetical protein CDAR_42601 [Caerostris darwini]